MIEPNEEKIEFNSSTNKEDKKKLLSRARAKYFTLGLMFGMVDLKDSPLVKKYWDTYYCASAMVQEDDKITSRYCKNRWCVVCNRVRTAINIRKYADIVKSWGSERYFVTLTIPNVTAEFLPITIDSMFNAFRNIRKIYNRNNISFIGIRKLECTYNPKEDTYHPHFHCIIKGEKEAELLIVEWLKRFPLAEDFCQDIRQADDNSVMELFKYFTKLITSKYNKADDKAPAEYKRKIYIESLDITFQSIFGRRTFQSFGFKGNIIDEEEEKTIRTEAIYTKTVYWDWENEVSDWINRETGEPLTQFKPKPVLKYLVDDMKPKSIQSQYNIDTTSQ